MNSPVPAFLPWATATAFVPIATATATPFPPAVLAQTGPVVYPSIYLPDLAIWVTCPSTVCNPIGSNSTFSLVDKSVTLYHDAVNFAARIAFGKSPAPAPVLNHAVPSVDAPTPTRKPHTQTVSAPDVQSAYLLPPGSYLLWSPWKEDPSVKWGYLYTVAQIRNKTWWALEKSGILAFTHKHCPVTHKSGPYIWYQGGPFVFEWIMLLGQLLWIVLLLLLMACLAMAGKAASLALLVKEFALDRRPWVLERVVRSPESVASAAGETISDLRNVGPWVIEHVARSTE